MNRLTILKYLLITFVCLPYTGQGQAKKDTLRINLQQALEIALSDNPTIKIADKEVQRVDYTKKEAWFGLLPTLSGSAQYTRNVKLQTMALAGQSIKIGQDNVVSLGLTLSLPLIVPALWKSIQLTELDMQLALEKARSSKINMRYDVKVSYYNTLMAQDAYVITQESYQIAKKNYEETKQRYEVGITSEYDYVSAEVKMHNSYPAVLEAENAVIQTKLFLKVLLGINNNVEIEIQDALTDYEGELTALSNVTASIENNTDLVQLDIQLKQLHKQLQLQRTQRLPMLSGFGNIQYQGMGMDDDQVGMDFTTGAPSVIPGGMNWYDPSLAIGLQLNVPIFDGMTKIMKEKQIKLAAMELELQREYVASQLNVQVITSLDNMRKAIEQVTANKHNVELANKVYLITQKRYDTGSGTLLELQNSTLELSRAKLLYVQAISTYLTAKADYEKTIGQ